MGVDEQVAIANAVLGTALTVERVAAFLERHREVLVPSADQRG